MKKIVIHEKFDVRKSAWETGEKINNWKNFFLENRCNKLIVVRKIGVKIRNREMIKKHYDWLKSKAKLCPPSPTPTPKFESKNTCR